MIIKSKSIKIVELQLIHLTHILSNKLQFQPMIFNTQDFCAQF